MEKYYGILFDRQNIDIGIYLFKPVYIVEGKVKENEYGSSFIDAIDDEYSFMDDSNTILFEDAKVVGSLIKESDFRSKYPNMSLKDAKSMFFEETKKFAFLGFYVPTKDVIKIVNFSLTDIMNNIDKKIVFESNLTPTKFTPKDFYDRLIHFYHTSYGSLKALKTKKELDDGIDIVDRGFMAFSIYIDRQEVNPIAKDYILDKLFTYIDELNNAKTLDFELAKKELTRIYATHNSEFVNMEKVLMPTPTKKVVKENHNVPLLPPKRLPNVREIKAYFDDKIIGQEEAKKDVIASIIMNEYSKNVSDKNACLLVGPTGSGKTLIAETVSEYFDKPIEIIDTTQLTMPGYVGANIEDFLSRLIATAGGDIKKAEHGIVVFDEIDKKGSESNDDVSGKGVLNTLLPFLQGTTYDVKYNGKVVHFSTKDLTIFATGAFTDVALSKTGTRHSSQRRIGFIIDDDTKNEDIKYEKLEIEDFVKYGNMPIEIMGRFSVIAQLDGHTKESLKRILTDSSISPLNGEIDKLANLGIKLEYTPEYLDAVVDEAFKLKTGARSLKSIVEKSVKVARWEALENMGVYTTIVLSSDTVLDNTKYKIIDKFGNIIEHTEKVKKKEG